MDAHRTFSSWSSLNLFLKTFKNQVEDNQLGTSML